MLSGFKRLASASAVRFFAVLLAVTSLLQACAADPVPEASEKEYSRVMIMVSAGYNNLSPYLRDDLDELLASSERGYLPPQGSNRALVLVTHLAKPASSTLQMYGTPTDICVIRASRDFRGQVLRDTLKTFTGNLMLTDADTFRTVLEYVASEFPSDSYGMVYSSHATGWLPCGYYAKSDVAIGWSEAPGNRENSPLGVDLSEWSDGIPVKAIGEETRIESGSRVSNDMDIIDFAASIPMKLDYLIFDACLMGGIEVAYQLRNVTRFVGFSQAEVGAEGFCYDTMAGRLLCEQKVAGPLAVCRDYFESYARQSSSVYRSATVSYVDCSRLDVLADVCAGLFEKYRQKLKEVNWRQVQGFFRYEKRYFFDLRDMLDKCGADAADLAELDRGLDGCILYRAATDMILGSFRIDAFCGLSMYLPSAGNVELDYYYKTLDWNKVTGLVL